MNKLIIISLFFCLCSCGFIHKTFDRKVQQNHETQKLSKDSSGTKTSDSLTSKTSDSAGIKKSEEKKTADVDIEFSDSSGHNKVEITSDSSGKQTIKAEGSIKSVKTTKQQEKKSTDSFHVAKSDTASKKASEQTNLKSNSASKTDNSSTVVHKKKTSFQIPWYGYLIGILVLIAIGYYLYRKYRFNIVAWFIQLKNPGSKVYYDPKTKGYQVIFKNTKNPS